MDYFDYENIPSSTELPDTWDLDLESLLEESQKNERRRIDAELSKIQGQLEERDQLHNQILDELESKLDSYLSKLDKLYLQRRGKNGRREELKNQIRKFYREIREENQMHWQDRQKLERERRKLLRELEELTDSEPLFGKIL